MFRAVSALQALQAQAGAKPEAGIHTGANIQLRLRPPRAETLTLRPNSPRAARGAVPHPFLQAPKLLTTCAFGGSNTFRSGPLSSPHLNWLRSKGTSFVESKVTGWDLGPVTLCHRAGWGVGRARAVQGQEAAGQI